tara:strand:+ start:1072 stop:1467 length:396 start_codon:yes stop_codon:yes gene_type:complete
MTKKNRLLINSLWWLSLFLGLLIYLFFRPNNLIYNNFISFPIKLNIEANSIITNFLIYSLPNGLWSFSYAQLIFHIYKDFSSKIILLSSLMVFFGILIEILQYQGFVSGFFDLFDIFSYLLFHIIILIIQK